MSDYPPLMNVADVMEATGIRSRTTIYRLIRDEEIPSVRIGPKLIKIPRDRLFAQLGLTGKAADPAGTGEVSAITSTGGAGKDHLHES